MSTPQYARSQDGASIAYEVQGQGPALVFVHGLGARREVWSSVIETLADGFRCVALDLRGHGDSDARADFEAFGLARDVLAVMDALQLPRAVLVGHSLGGFVVSVTAAQAGTRVRGVINVDQPLALATLGENVRALGPALQAAPVADLLMSVLEQLGLGPLDPAQVATLRGWREQLPRAAVLGAWSSLLANDDSALGLRMDRLLARITCPYLSLHGCTPPADYPHWLAQRLPHVQRVHWENAGHFPHLCRAAALAGLARGWVQALPDG